MGGDANNALCDTFDMLVARLTDVEQTTRAILDAMRFDAENAPAEHIIPPSLLGRTDDIRAKKLYDGRLKGRGYASVDTDIFESGASVVESLEWALGEHRSEIDSAVEVAIGKAKADEIRGRVYEYLCAHPNYGDDDNEEWLNATDVGLDMPCAYDSFTMAWWCIGIKQIVPEVVAIGQYELVIKLGPGCDDCGKVMDVVARAHGVLGNKLRDRWEYEIDLIHPAFVPLVEVVDKSQLEARWKSLTAREQNAIARMQRRPWENTWFKSTFKGQEQVLKRLIDALPSSQ